MLKQDRKETEATEPTPAESHQRSYLPIREIVTATDFLPVSRLALDYAALFATRFLAKLTIFHSFEYGPYGKTVEIVEKVPCLERRDAEARTKALSSGLKTAGVDASWSIEEGEVPFTVLSAVKSLHADLLVIGTQGIHRGLSHLVLGSNTEAILLNSTCPTLTIGPHVHGGVEPSGGFSKVRCLVDFSSEAAMVAMYAHDLATAFDCPVELEHFDARLGICTSEEIRQKADQFCRTVRNLGITVPPEWLSAGVRASRTVQLKPAFPGASDVTSLLVLGATRQKLLQRHLHASLPYKVLAEAVCPVLSVPFATL